MFLYKRFFTAFKTFQWRVNINLKEKGELKKMNKTQKWGREERRRILAFKPYVFKR